MHRLFLPIYRFFSRHRVWMWLSMLLSAAVFVFFGLKLTYEEDLTKLLPSSSTDSELAFGNIRVKDKVFIQVTSDNPDPAELAACLDAFMEELVARDSTVGSIANALWRLDEDEAMNVLDYALGHVPSYVDTACYALFAKALEPAAVRARMKENARLLAGDETGAAGMLVTTDPLGLRYALLESLKSGGASAPSGFALVDGHIFCADTTVALAFLSPDSSSMDSRSNERLVEQIESGIRAFEKSWPGMKVYYHGSPVNGVFNARRIKKDLVLTIGISLLLILLLVSVSFRSSSILWLQLLPVLYGTFFGMACMYWIKGTMSLMALGIGAVVLGVALSYCLHVLIHYRFVTKAAQVLRDESTPVFLGCITTVGAFLGLLFTESDLLQDFGLFSSFALLGSTLFALVWLPHFLFPVRRDRNKKVFLAVDRFNAYPYERKPLILIGVLAVVVTGIVFSPKVVFDSDLQHLAYFDSHVLEARRLYAEKNLSGAYQAYYATVSEDLDEALEGGNALAASLDSLQREGMVRQYAAVAPKFFPTQRVQQERIRCWKEWWTPERVALARSRLDAAARAEGLSGAAFEPFYAMVGADYTPESLYDAQLLPESITSNFIECNPEGKYLVFTSVRIDSTARDSLARRLTRLPRTIVIDPFFYTNDMVEVVHGDFSVALLISSLFVLLVLLLSFRNLWIALIAFLPMSLSWYVTQGLMALLGVPFNLINIVVSTFIFGIGVDYSIFVMEGLLAEARRGDAKMLEYHKAAIFFSAVILVIVILSLMFAVHPAISSIGLSTLIGMVSTIVITYTLQPFLFRQCLRVSWLRKSFGAKD